MYKISVVVTTYNSGDFLSEFFEQLLREIESVSGFVLYLSINSWSRL